MFLRKLFAREDPGYNTLKKQIARHKGYKNFKKLFDVKCRKCGSDLCLVSLYLPEFRTSIKQQAYETLPGFRCGYCGSVWYSDLSIGDRIKLMKNQQNKLWKGYLKDKEKERQRAENAK